MSHCTGCLRNCEKSKEIRDPNAMAGATSHPREPTQTAGSGNREPGGFCAAGSPPDTCGVEEKLRPMEVTPGRAAGRSAPGEASPKGEQMTRGRQATRKHARSLGGITADESKENIPHDCLENLCTPPGCSRGHAQDQVCPRAVSCTEHPAPCPLRAAPGSFTNTAALGALKALLGLKRI